MDTNEQLATVTDTGKPVKNRITSVDQARAVYRRMKDEQDSVARQRALILNQYNGNAPFSQSELNSRGEGWRSNVNPREAKNIIDTAACAIWEMLTSTPELINVVCTGAEPVAVTNCLNFGNPEKPGVMGQFVHVVEGMADACKALGTPVISGNVSFYNESGDTAVYPTAVVGMVGLIAKIKNQKLKIKNKEDILYCTMDFKNKGDVIVLLGENKDELGGSEYLKVVHNLEKGRVPELFLNREKAVQQTCLEAIRKGVVCSAHDISEGGLAVSIAESSIFGDIGVMISLISDIRIDSLLFGETQSRIILTLSPENFFSLEEIARHHAVPVNVIGKVGGKRVIIKRSKKSLIDVPVASLKKTYFGAIEEAVK